MEFWLSRTKPLVLAAALLCGAWPAAGAPPGANKAAASAAIARDSESCRSHANIDACYDAIRWNPNDPALLVALADAFVVAKRPADALRNYKRAAALAPQMPGLAAKMTAVEAKKAAKPRVSRSVPAEPRSASTAASPRYSNAAPESQSH